MSDPDREGPVECNGQYICCTSCEDESSTLMTQLSDDEVGQLHPDGPYQVKFIQVVVVIGYLPHPRLGHVESVDHLTTVVVVVVVMTVVVMTVVRRRMMTGRGGTLKQDREKTGSTQCRVVTCEARGRVWMMIPLRGGRVWMMMTLTHRGTANILSVTLYRPFPVGVGHCRYPCNGPT